MTRSAAEQEVRDAVVAHLRALRPGSRICHEVNVAGQGSNRVDVMAIGASEIIAVEIKSKRDKLDRLAEQVPAMHSVAHQVVVAFHEKFLVERETNKWSSQYQRDGKHFLTDVPDAIPHSVYRWIYPIPEKPSVAHNPGVPSLWPLDRQPICTPAPHGALGMLWRDELRMICNHLRVSANSRSNMGTMMRDLLWHCNGGELTKGICTALRSRPFAEADPPLYQSDEPQKSLLEAK